MKKHRIGVHVEKNAFVDAGDGTISFPSGQVIIDSSTLRNGFKYDIESMDLTEYKGQVTADHVDMISYVIGEALGLAKREDAVTISGIRLAVKQSALAKLAYDLLVGGFPLDLSIETYGPWPDDSDDTYYKAKLIGLSVVVVGNSRSTTMNELVRNSLEQAKQEGLDTTDAEKVAEVEVATPPEPVTTVTDPKPEPQPEQPKEVPQKESISKEQQKMFVTIKNGRGFPVTLSYKNAAGEVVETELQPGQTVDVSDDQKDAVEKQLTDAAEPKPEQPDVKEAVENALKDALKPVTDKLAEMEQNGFDRRATEPEFQPGAPAATHTNSLKDLHWKERTGLQVQALTGVLLNKSFDSMKRLNDINQHNLEKLKEAGLVKNTITLTDLGNFVVPPEMVSEIQGYKTDYSTLLARFPFQETLSLKMTWLERNGEIEMEDVDMEDHGDNEDLKPLKEYSTTTKSADLVEFAAVTPVDASAVRFAAVDVVEDISQSYRRAYDQALSRSIIGRLEKAIESNGNSVAYNYSSGAGGNVAGLIALLNAWKRVAEKNPNGVFIFTASTYAELLARTLYAGVTGPLASVFTTGDVPTFFGRPYVVVPGNLLPDLNSAATKAWTFENVSVTVNHAIIYADPADFKGRVSGGLNFNMSTEAAYEEGGTVKSAYQRDKILFRGYGYRKSAVTDTSKVAGILSPGIS